MAIQHIPRITCDPGAENEFATGDSTFAIDTFVAGDWDGSSGSNTVWHSDTSGIQAVILAPSGVHVKYSTWQDIKNIGSQIDATNTTNVNGGRNSGITFNFNITSTPDKTATEGTLYTYHPTTDGTPTAWFVIGPSGMSVNSSSGVVSWVPSYDRTNSGPIHLTASGVDSYASQDWTTTISFVTPSITNSPRTDATEHVLYTYTPTATVVDLYRYDLTGAPSGMTVNPSSGLVSWTPGYDRTNSGPLTLTLRSSNGLTDHKDWTIAVSFINPSISSTPGKTATEGSVYSYVPSYSVQDLDTWALTGAPIGMSFNAQTGIVLWEPNYDQTNSGPLRLTLNDLNGLSTYQDWTVASQFVVPVITSTPDATAYVGSNYTYTPTKTAVHIDEWTLAGAPARMNFDQYTGAINWIPTTDQTSSGTLVLTLKTLNGYQADQTFSIAVDEELSEEDISQPGLGCVGPYGQTYFLRNSWILDTWTNLEVGVKQFVDFS